MQKISVVSWFGMALILTAVGCGSERSNRAPADRDGAAQGTTAAVEEPEHALAAVQPGSHEDWCGEHAVPESMCTRCNPSLIAAFKATGDWCAEHGLPESQCLTCNPDLKIVRPPKNEGAQ